MHKIWIVARSEFLRRVTSKWFVIITLLAPLLMIALTVLPGILAASASQTEQRTVAVVDETAVLLPRLQALAGDQFQFVEAAAAETDALRQAVRSGVYDGYLVLPADVLSGKGLATYYGVESGGFSLNSRLERLVDRSVEQERLDAQNVPPEVLDIFNTDISVRMMKLTEAGEAASNAGFSAALGLFMGFVIYIAMLIYGSQVMYGAMEEKASRVVEVMISSVRPFQLLMGKVLGIGAMGLLQMLVWSALTIAAITFAGSIAALFLDPADLSLPADATQQEVLDAANFVVPSIAPEVFVWFILFFLGGYLLYASLFAAVGSAVEQQQDAQSLMFPITLLIIIPILFITFLNESPNSALAIGLSLVPFFSPILMVVRVAITEVPFWQVALAYMLLVLAFIGGVWVSSRIYRVGILMYGKKPSLMDLLRWFRYA